MEEVQTISFNDKEYMITDEIIIDNIKQQKDSPLLK